MKVVHEIRWLQMLLYLSSSAIFITDRTQREKGGRESERERKRVGKS